MEKDKVYLQHILDAIEYIEKFIQGKTREEFRHDELVISGVIRKLEIIGEATKKISEDLKIKHKKILWRQASGMRDNLIHEYFNVDLKQVWDTIHTNLPEFKSVISDILKNENRI